MGALFIYVMWNGRGGPTRGFYAVRGRGAEKMESDLRYYTRRLDAERLAAARAVTTAARERRLMLVASYQRKIEALTA